MKSNITTIGGGTGTFNVLSGLGKNRKLNLAAIVTVADSGGSTGELRDEFGILPPGDIRRAIVALSEDTEVFAACSSTVSRKGEALPVTPSAICC